MDEWLKIAILYGIGAVVLGVEMFVPSQGVLFVLGMGLFGWGLYEAFAISFNAGVATTVALMIVLPTAFVIAVRNWHRTPIGRRISPPNPKLTEADRLPTSDLEALLGQTGRTITMLRPVGICDFAGRRVESSSEAGLIAAGVQVQAVRLSDRTVVVRPATPA